MSPPHQSPTIPLPLELRTKILADLLVNPWTLHIIPHPSNIHLLEQIKPNFTLNDTPTAKQFSSLCLVSKAMRSEARHVFFSQNTWELELNLGAVKPSKLSRRSISRDNDIEVLVKTHMDSTQGILEHWGDEALDMMRNIEIRLLINHPRAEKSMEEALTNLVKVLKRGGSMRKMVVRYSANFGLEGHKCGNGRMAARRRILESERNLDGTRESDDMEELEEMIGMWARSEWVLKPVLELRPVKDVRVIGCVTDSWAEWLERQLKSNEETCQSSAQLEASGN